MSNKMKDSGIDWIGEVPEHWDVRRVSSFFTSQKAKTKPGRVDVLSLTLNGVIEKDLEVIKGLSPESYDTYQVFKKDDLVFKLIDLANYQTSRVGRVWKNGIMSSAYIRLSKKKSVNNDYFYYQFFDLYKRAVFNSLGGNGVRSAINRSDLLRLNIVAPPKNEQQRIAEFLDRQTSIIDKQISLLEQKVEKLNEYKQSLIYETATKGLDANVKMKDSGIEWIGEIPEHWDVRRVKDVFNIGRGRVIAASDVEKNQTDVNKYPVYSAAAKNNGIIGYINTFDFDLCLLTWTTDGVNAGTIFTRSGKFNCTNVCGTLIPKNKMKSINFYKYALEVQAPNYKRADINGAKIMNNEMSAILIAVPPTEKEKIYIHSLLDAKSSKIDKQISLLEQKVEKLKEYKQALIYEAVTGKILIQDNY